MTKNRDPNSGFTLLESLIAFAILAMVIGAGYAILSQSLGRQARLAQDLELSRFARTILIEYAVTYPKLPGRGVFDERLSWEITEEQQSFTAPERMALPNVIPIKVIAEVRRVDGNVTPLRFATVLLRGAQQ